MTRLLFAAYFLEAGLILIVAPWSGFWERNRFAQALPTLAPFFASPFVRGGISGIGVITALAGLAEVIGVLSRKLRPNHSTPSAPNQDR